VISSSQSADARMAAIGALQPVADDAAYGRRCPIRDIQQNAKFQVHRTAGETVCPEFRLLLGRIVAGCDASGLPLWPGNRSSIAPFGQPKVEGAGEREPGGADSRSAADASSLRERYLSSQTSSMRQPLKMLLTMIVCPFT
jgi:hypothetical protein